MAVTEHKSMDNNDILFTPHSYTFSGIQQSLFCLDTSTIRLRIKRAELNKQINNPDCSYLEKSQLRKELKNVTKQIGKKLFYQRDFNSSEIDMLVREYKTWLHEPLFLTFYDEEKKNYTFHRASKRGNSIYRKQVKENLLSKTGFFEDPNFDKLMLREKKADPGFRKTLQSNVLFITLTWNPNIFLGSRKRAWLSIEYFYNKFITRFRKTYGTTWVLKGVESTQDGYPHIHIIAICAKSFETFKHRSQPTKENPESVITYRIKEKPKIAKSWPSFVDILVPTNVQAVKDYILKDIIKQYDKGEHKSKQDFLSLAFCWLFRKQGYAISGFSHDLISEGITQTQVEKILSSPEGKNLIYQGMIKLDFSFPYLKHLKGKPPPDILSVKLSNEQKDSLVCHITCRPNKDLNLRKQLQSRKIQTLIEKYKFNQELAEIIKKQHKIQEEKMLARLYDLQDGKKIELDLQDKLSILAFGKC